MQGLTLSRHALDISLLYAGRCESHAHDKKPQVQSKLCSGGVCADMHSCSWLPAHSASPYWHCSLPPRAVWIYLGRKRCAGAAGA